MSSRVIDVPLRSETERRYLNYALSVITSRALPDVRDGLKPVQRRILYAMYRHLKLLPDGRFRKSATIVGEVMGKYHPHGDQSIYDAMVRMAQPFSLLHPLIEGYGNFGSIDGDRAAAMRYTEARLQPISLELLGEIEQNTVEFKPNFDGTLREPVVLPAKFPHLLVNGSSGIAVGMATNIPPHNLREVIGALLLYIENPECSTSELLSKLKGPDFPTGGEMIASKADLKKIYETGQGSVLLRGRWKEEVLREGRKSRKQLVITSVPYGVNRSSVVEKIAELILEKRHPSLVDVRDESTEETRIVVELKAGADPARVVAFLYKNTPLQQKFSVNLTCLVPTEPAGGVLKPKRVSLREILEHFVEFRLETLRRRFQNELDGLRKKIHLLEGFKTVLDDLELALEVIRRAEGRSSVIEALVREFGLDREQAEAVAETKLYRLSSSETERIRRDLRQLRWRADDVEAILSSRRLLLRELRGELSTLLEQYSRPRKTKISRQSEEPDFSPEDAIPDEKTNVVLTRDGWVKRIRTIGDYSSIRLREGDQILKVLPSNTRDSICFFSDQGWAYTARVWNIPATSGYGVPLQSLFKFRDGERVVSALIFSIQNREKLLQVKGNLSEKSPGGQSVLFEAGGEEGRETGNVPPPSEQILVVTERGLGVRISPANFVQPSVKTGRKFIRLSDGDRVLFAERMVGGEFLVLLTRGLRVLLFPAEEVKFLSSVGKGVRLIQLESGDSIFSAFLLREGQFLRVEGTERAVSISPESQRPGSRLGKGRKLRSLGDLLDCRIENKPEELGGSDVAERGAEGDADER